MTSDALTDILCARSATEIVSGTCTSMICGSVGAPKLDELSPRPPPRRPPRPPGAFQLLRPAPESLRPLLAVGAPRFLASSAQLEDSFSDLTDFLSPGLAAPAGAGAPAAVLGLWMVPLMPAAAASA